MDSIGQVFTPLAWGKFAVERSGILPHWLAGQSVFDPTAGEGSLLCALVESALDAGHRLEQLPLDRLFGLEIDPVVHRRSLDLFHTRYGVDMGSQFRCGDLFATDPKAYDILFGNPPWRNFADLPTAQKESFKALFLEYGLVPELRKALLGGSRVDLAALVVQKTILEFLRPGGEAWFFLPLSLFLNDGAHTPFRGYHTGGVPFAPRVLYDFQDEPVFGSVATRYGLVGFLRDQPAVFPVVYHRKGTDGWYSGEAAPAFGPDAPLSVGDPGSALRWTRLRPIVVDRRSVPRQGVNTGGANKVFFFDRCEPVGDLVRVRDDCLLPAAYVHPLVTGGQFRGVSAPSKWVLIPHDTQGRPLDPEALAREPELKAYLEQNRAPLMARRGTLVGARVTRGLWWAIQGIGPYSFSPYKVIWEAYGKAQFAPQIFEGTWQANQSLQAFFPCWTMAEAQRILGALLDPGVEAYLRSLQMENTMNWAQPGRLRRLLSFTDGDDG